MYIQTVWLSELINLCTSDLSEMGQSLQYQTYSSQRRTPTHQASLLHLVREYDRHGRHLVNPSDGQDIHLEGYAYIDDVAELGLCSVVDSRRLASD